MGAEHVERAVAVREVPASDADPALRLNTELRPRIESRPQEQLDRNPACVCRVPQPAPHAPDTGAVAFRFKVYQLREQSRDLASDSRLLWIAVIAGPILP